MKRIQVLGVGCANCKATLLRIEEAAQSLGVPIETAKVEDIQDIMKFGIMSTPGVVVDGKVVHAGGVPSREKVLEWLRA